MTWAVNLASLELRTPMWRVDQRRVDQKGKRPHPYLVAPNMKKDLRRGQVLERV
ncbi:MAG: hypothetical protein ACYCS7_10625 [Acidimicrobiales bacterium]